VFQKLSIPHTYRICVLYKLFDNVSNMLLNNFGDELDACSVYCHASIHFGTVAIRYSKITIIMIVTSCAIKALLQHITTRLDSLWLTASSMRTELCVSDMLNYLFDNISYSSLYNTEVDGSLTTYVSITCSE
jgi:hypothetical protein